MKIGDHENAWKIIVKWSWNYLHTTFILNVCLPICQKVNLIFTLVLNLLSYWILFFKHWIWFVASRDTLDKELLKALRLIDWFLYTHTTSLKTSMLKDFEWLLILLASYQFGQKKIFFLYFNQTCPHIIYFVIMLRLTQYLLLAAIFLLSCLWLYVLHFAHTAIIQTHRD